MGSASFTTRRVHLLSSPLYSLVLLLSPTFTAVSTRLQSNCSLYTTLRCPAEFRMLTALSIEQYSFSTFTTIVYRPPCGGVALDVYNYS